MAQISTFNWQSAVLGSVNGATFTFQNDDGSAYNITGATWEYVIRIDQYDRSAVPLVSITTTSSAEGVLVPNTTNSTLALTLFPAATSSLKAGTYFHTLWMNPGTTSALAWVTGLFSLVPAAQS